MSSLLPTDTADLRARLLAHPDFAADADRAALVQLLDQQRRYGLVWEDKPEAVEETLRQYLPVLEAVPARALNADQPAVPQHTLIEGDNLHALTVLSYTHAAQVDVIYIDPPYNTGNRDFIYNDRFVDREDGYRHSKWLSFMAKRLKLAKTLLKDTGVIFISIDDNEQAQLKLLCDEVFGEENFVANVVWQKNFSVKNDSKFFSQEHEFVLVYAKQISSLQLELLIRGEKQNARYKNPDNHPKGVWASSDLLRMEHRDNSVFAFTAPNGRQWIPKPGTSWRHPLEELNALAAKDEIWFGPDGNGMPRRKRFLSEVKQGVVPQTIWKYEEVGHTQEAKQEVKSILDETQTPFDTPKPIKLIRQILQLTTNTNKSALILDFFAGSGTTLHATMALNAEDGGSRRCILVTNNENNICEQVTYERNRRVIRGYTTPKGAAVPGLAANALRYYRCVAPVPRTPTPRHKRELVRRATDLLCLKEDCYQLLPGVPAGAGFAAFGSPSAATVIVYDEAAVEEAATFIGALPVPAAAPAGRPWCATYVLAAGSYAYDDEFAAVADRVRLSALPEALYRAWQSLLPQEGAMRAIEEAAAAGETGLAAAPPAAPAGQPAAGPPGAPAAATAPPKADKRGNLHLF